MKITNFKVKTRNGEVVKLEEIETLSFGILVDDRFKAETKELFITCKQGHLKFSLDEIGDISFNLDHEKHVIRIDSRWEMKEGANGAL